MVAKFEKLIFEYSKEGRTSFDLAPSRVPDSLNGNNYPAGMLRGGKDELPKLPEVSENEIIRHYTNLSRLN